VPYCQHCGSPHADDATFCPQCGSWVGDVGSLPAHRAPPRYAGFWARVGAQVIDQIVVGVPFQIVTGLLVTYTPPTVKTTTDAAGNQNIHWAGDWGTFGLVLLASWLVTLIYTSVLISSARQATVGKMALGLIVTDEDGERVSLARAAGRYAAGILNAATLGVGYLMVIWTPRKQALHDRVAGTVVVPRARRGSA
jgi:uncharacterized RDD family membrane protein YckC